MNNLNFLSCPLGLNLLIRVSEWLLLRLPSGTTVRVKSPSYAAGLMGVIQAHEKGITRWLVSLHNNPFEDSNKPVLLSLELSDFEVIELPPIEENTEPEQK